MYFTPVYIMVLILHTNTDKNVFFTRASCLLHGPSLLYTAFVLSD